MAHIDLHLHSSISMDGEFLPRTLAEQCHKSGIHTAALTDHNSIEGVSEFSWSCAQFGIRTIPGIELDCYMNTLHLHILGYGIDITNTELLQVQKSVQTMYQRAPGKPAHVPMQFISAQKAVRMIHDAGGIAVLAHPGANIATDFEMLSSIFQLPIDGIEVFSSYHDALTTAYYLNFARDNHLLITGGTDFHGKIKPNVKIGNIDMLNMEDVLQKKLLSVLA